jgi:ubiquinone/menaquinone biosynthesis C-methylase UbiE
MLSEEEQTKRWSGYWDKHAKSYDWQVWFFDKLLFRDSREWACKRAVGDVLEVGIGTGLSLHHYPRQARLTAVEFSPGMLEIARRRSAELDRQVDLREGNALSLDFPDESFDSVVAAFALCSVADERVAVAEIRRVLRPGGLLLLADHVASRFRVLRGFEWLLEVTCVPRGAEHFLRRPLATAREAGFVIEHTDRFAFGVVERVVARKPGEVPEPGPGSGASQ